MKYNEVNFTYRSSIDNDIVKDVLASELGNIGFDSFMETDKGLQGYIAVNLFDESKLKQLLKSFPLEQVEINYTIQPLEDKDWNEEWEKNSFQPIKVGHECIIRAPYHKAEAGYKYEIIIDPQLSFGTGHHQTTYMAAVDENLFYTDAVRNPKGDAVSELEKAIDKLKNYKQLDDSTVAVNLKYIIHLTGDMHCPAHE